MYDTRCVPEMSQLWLQGTQSTSVQDLLDKYFEPEQVHSSCSRYGIKGFKDSANISDLYGT